MLIPTQEIVRQRQSIERDLAAGKIDPAAAAERLSQFGDDPMICLVRGNARVEARDLDGAEWWYWKGLDLQPTRFAFYKRLAAVRHERDPDDLLAPRLNELALSKLGSLPKIHPDVAEQFRKSMGSSQFDFDDPETYQMLASLREIEREKQNRDEDWRENPEVYERLRPYILLDRLQRGATNIIDYGVLRQIQEYAAQCLPLLSAAIYDWATFPDGLHPKATSLLLAM